MDLLVSLIIIGICWVGLSMLFSGLGVTIYQVILWFGKQEVHTMDWPLALVIICACICVTIILFKHS